MEMFWLFRAFLSSVWPALPARVCRDDHGARFHQATHTCSFYPTQSTLLFYPTQSTLLFYPKPKPNLPTLSSPPPRTSQHRRIPVDNVTSPMSGAPTHLRSGSSSASRDSPMSRSEIVSSPSPSSPPTQILTQNPHILSLRCENTCTSGAYAATRCVRAAA